jgi:hypothetical protein
MVKKKPSRNQSHARLLHSLASKAHETPKMGAAMPNQTSSRHSIGCPSVIKTCADRHYIPARFLKWSRLTAKSDNYVQLRSIARRFRFRRRFSFTVLFAQFSRMPYGNDTSKKMPKNCHRDKWCSTAHQGRKKDCHNKGCLKTKGLAERMSRTHTARLS